MKYLRNEPLKKHTSFKIGGPADYFCAPKSVEEVIEALQFSHEHKLPVAIIGAGTNLLALDKGFRGMAIKLAGGLNKITVQGNTAYAGAGVYIPLLLKTLLRKGLSGLEFMFGIPGTVGGALVMNAEAWGKEIGSAVVSADVIDGKGKAASLNRKNLRFGYRKSALQSGKWIVTGVIFKLKKDKPSNIRKRMEEYLRKRIAAQPLGIPSAGSIFKNPKFNRAGKILDETGCKGMRVGDAAVSKKHANFIVNLGEATARDVIRLMTKMQKAAKVALEPEIRIVVKSPL